MNSSIIDYFRKINNIHNTTSKKEVDLYNAKKHILYDFDDRLLSFLVKVKSEDRYIIIMDSTKDKVKKIISKPDQPFSSGDYVEWEGQKWIVTETDPNQDIYTKGYMQECSSSLKWLDSLGAIKEVYFTQTTDNQRGLGLQDDKMMISSDERRSLIVQKNVDTIQIQKTQRFIFDEGRCWRVTGINSLTTNLLTLEFEETLLSETKDNVALRIADYFIHDYSIHISNGNSVNLAVNDTLQLDVVVKDDGTIMSLPVTYSTSDNSIATVSSGGLITAISNGSVSIRASLTNDPNTFTTMNVNVSEVVESGWTLDINGSDFCKVNQIQRFTGTVKNNGVTDTSKLIRWTLYDDSGTLPTTLGVIISQSGHEVIFKANSKHTGHVKIKGTCYGANNLTVEDIAMFTVADLSSLTVDDLAHVGFTTENAEQVAVQTVDGLFNLGLTIEQMATLTVSELAMYTVGDLEDETVLVSAIKRVQIRSLI